MASSTWLTYACRMHADRLPNHFTIGQASRQSGVSAKAIRLIRKAQALDAALAISFTHQTEAT